MAGRGFSVSKRVGVWGHEGADWGAPFFAGLLEGMKEGIRGFSLCVNPDLQESLDGIISIAPESDDPRLAIVRARSIPVVVVAGRIPECPCVDVDNRHMAETATTHLLVSGRRRLALINGKLETSNGRDRAEGFRAAMNNAGVVFSDNLQFDGRFSREGGRAAMETFLREGPPPDAVFAANDHMALGAWVVLERHGLRVPDDVALVGIDDIPEAAKKGLTTVQQPLREMGRHAAEQLGNCLRTGTRPTENVEAFKGILIVRRSSERRWENYEKQ